MARPVAKGFTVHLTASLKAGIRVLEELRSQGRIKTASWYHLKAEPIDNNGSYSNAYRTLIFTLEDNIKVEIKEITWKQGLGDDARGDAEERKWVPSTVWVQKNGRMECLLSNDVDRKPRFRWPRGDKPLPGTKWRAPTVEEIEAYHTAVQDRDKTAFLKIYYADLISWDDLNSKLGINTAWVNETLKEAAA